MSSNTLLLFPGQGSQAVGMATHLWDFEVARETFFEASEVLGWDVGELCRTGTMDELTRTDRTQPAILACSVATLRVLTGAGLRFSVAAGHSLGEYSALVAAGYLEFGDAVRLVDIRGRAMHACGSKRGGTMAAILGLDDEEVEDICSSLENVWAANFNCPGQVVVSGAPEAVKAAGQMAVERGAKRVVPLAVSGAFHTPFMAEAAEVLGAVLERTTFVDPGRQVFFSTTELRFPHVTELPEVLKRQVTSPVKFTQSIRLLAGIDRLGDSGEKSGGESLPVTAAIEVGPGNVLTGLVRRIAKDLPVKATLNADSLREVMEEISNAEH